MGMKARKVKLPNPSELDIVVVDLVDRARAFASIFSEGAQHAHPDDAHEILETLEVISNEFTEFIEKYKAHFGFDFNYRNTKGKN